MLYQQRIVTTFLLAAASLAGCVSSDPLYCELADPTCPSEMTCDLSIRTCVPIKRDAGVVVAAGPDGGDARAPSDGRPDADGAAADAASSDGGEADAGPRDSAPEAAPVVDRDGDGDPDATDCAPDDATVFHNQVESCNDKDDNCDGVVDGVNSEGCTVYFIDADDDTYGVLGTASCLCAPQGDHTATRSGDCRDDNSAISPDGTESCNDLDDDCDGLIDDADSQTPAGCTRRYVDRDGDGYGRADDWACLCKPASPYLVTNKTDCYDGNDKAFPGQTNYFDQHRGDSSFDYDCDGLETRKWTGTGFSCSPYNFGGPIVCVPSRSKHWKDMEPACGTVGQLGACESIYTGDRVTSCRTVFTSVRQACL